MRIVHVLHEVKDVGNGITNNTVDLACTQAAMGHDVTVCSGGGAWEPLLTSSGVRVERIRLVPRSQFPASVFALRRVIRSVRPDILHAHTTAALLLARAAAPKMPLVDTAHNDWRGSTRLLALADCVIVLNEDAARRYRREGRTGQRGRRAPRVVLLLNGTVDSPRLPESDPPPHVELGHPSIVTVCGMYERKGVDVLLRAFALVLKEHPTAHLHVVGAGPDDHLFHDLATELDLGAQVHFEGFQSRPDSWMAACDVFVLASRREPSGLVLSEAQAHGCSVIASDIDGIPMMLDGGRAGMLVPPGDPQALGGALDSLLSDPAELARWRTASAAGAARLSVHRVAADVLTAYRDVLGAPAAVPATAPAGSPDRPARPVRASERT